MIPATIHQTWKTADVPARFAASAESWRTLHPAWEYRLWTDESLEAFVHETYPEMWDLYRRYPEQIYRVDAARYMLLHHFGGVYADLDIDSWTASSTSCRPGSASSARRTWIVSPSCSHQKAPSFRPRCW